jgi:hypothetical protein
MVLRVANEARANLPSQHETQVSILWNSTRETADCKRRVPLSKLEALAALIVLDLQKGIVSSPTVLPAGEIIGQGLAFSRLCRTGS